MLARAVGRAVVDDEHAVAGRVEHLGEGAHERLEVLALVVGGDADDRAGHARRVRARSARPGPRPYDRRMPSLPRNADVADALDELADVSEILGEQGFRVLAYRRAATRIRETGASIAELALAGSAKELPGIGATIEAKIVELARDRRDVRAREAPSRGSRTRSPSSCACPGLGPKTAARIWRELGVTTLDGLREAAEQQRVRTLQGLGAKSEERILEALAKGFGPEPERRGLLGVGLPVVRDVVEALREHPATVDVSGAGSVRRGKETFRDLDVIATATDPAGADRALRHALPWVLEVAAHGDTKATVVTKQGLRLDLRVVPPEDYGSLLQHFTGSKDHNVALREDAQRRGFSVSEYGVTVVETGEVHRFTDEDDLYRFLGYDLSRPSCARTAASSRPRASGGLPGWSSSRISRESSTATRRGRRTGRASIEEMALALEGARKPVPRADRPLALPPRRRAWRRSGRRSRR